VSFVAFVDSANIVMAVAAAARRGGFQYPARTVQPETRTLYHHVSGFTPHASRFADTLPRQPSSNQRRIYPAMAHCLLPYFYESESKL